jgi:hypothetical protein
MSVSLSGLLGVLLFELLADQGVRRRRYGARRSRSVRRYSPSWRGDTRRLRAAERRCLQA